MDRKDCWMTFSEALELYLDARQRMVHYGPGHNRRMAEQDLENAKKHMDALTSDQK